MLNFLVLWMLTIHPVSQTDRLFVANDSLFDSYGIINLGNRDGWRFQKGDDLNRARPEFDDSAWMFLQPAGLREPIPDSLWNGYGWFRYRFAADSSVYAKATHLYFSTWGAAEVYLDGRLVQRVGTFSTDRKGEELYTPYTKTDFSVVLRQGKTHLLAVRYSYHHGQKNYKLFGKYSGNYGFGIGLATDKLNQLNITQSKKVSRDAYIAGSMLFLIVLLHIFLFVLFPAERSNLYIAIVTFLLFLHNLTVYCPLLYELDILQVILFNSLPYVPLFMAALSMFPFTLNSMFHQKPKRIYQLLIWLFPVFALANFMLSGFGVNVGVVSVYMTIILFFTSQVLIRAWKNKQKGVWFVAGGFIGLIVSTAVIILYSRYSHNFKVEVSVALGYMVYLSVPLGLTAYMASRFRDLYTHLEQKVTERTCALNQSLEELRSTQTQLIHSEKMASLGALTAGIAHEIQNPLNFVNNFSEVNTELLEEMRAELKAGNHEEAIVLAHDIAENEKKINMHGKRADNIVKGMLQHSRNSSGIKELTDINALADEFLRLSYHGLRAKDKSFNATLKSDFDSSIGKIRVVSDEIGRVILNLLNNAFYAVSEKLRLNPEGYEPLVSVSTHKVGDLVEIKVRDNGNGIPQVVLDKIFQPFFTTKPTGMGTGLGLSMSYDIVKAHGGELKVKTWEGAGAEFIVQLDISRDK